MRYNEDMLDAITILSFMIGIANYGENLSQNDKDDMMQALDRKTNDMIERLEKDLEEQNKMLKEILAIMKLKSELYEMKKRFESFVEEEKEAENENNA